MKVLGISSEAYSRTYIVEVTHTELERAFEKGYHNELKQLKTGDSLDLSTIPDQRVRIESATRAMAAGYAEFVKAAPVMADFARLASSKTATPEGTQ